MAQEGDRVEDALAALQAWYAARCDGEWEHRFGVNLGTLDNPGWQLDVDLTDTDVAARAFERVERFRDDADWVVAFRDDRQWHGAGGALNLAEVIGLFVAWATGPEPEAAPVAPLTPDLVERLRGIGFDLALASRYGAERVRWALDALDTAACRGPVGQPMAWVARTLQEHWGVPREVVQRELPFAEAAAAACRPPEGTRWAREKATGALFTVQDMNELRVQLAGGVAVPAHHWGGWEWLAEPPEGWLAPSGPEVVEDPRRADLARMAAWVKVRTRTEREVGEKLASLGLTREEWDAYHR